MSIAPTCSLCHRELEEPGGLLFSPPLDDYWTVKKDHVCAECYPKLLELIGSEPWLP